MGNNRSGETDIYRELGILTDEKERWKESVPYVSSMLFSDSAMIRAKALWLLGEIGLLYPLSVKNTVPSIAALCKDAEPRIRSRAVNALGRIGRGGFRVIEPYWEQLFTTAADKDPGVRLSFVWASENIAVNSPEIYEGRMSVFETMLHDENDKVRMEAPEIFRVIGKRRPDIVMPYTRTLQHVAENDSNRVVRIHCTGAIRALSQALTDTI